MQWEAFEVFFELRGFAILFAEYDFVVDQVEKHGRLRPPMGGIARDSPRPASALRAASTRGGPRSKRAHDSGPPLRLRIGLRRAAAELALVHCRESCSSVRLVQSQLVSDAIDTASQALADCFRAGSQFGGDLGPLAALLAPFQKRPLIGQESPSGFVQEFAVGHLDAGRTARPGKSLDPTPSTDVSSPPFLAAPVLDTAKIAPAGGDGPSPGSLAYSVSSSRATSASARASPARTAPRPRARRSWPAPTGRCPSSPAAGSAACPSAGRAQPGGSPARIGGRALLLPAHPRPEPDRAEPGSHHFPRPNHPSLTRPSLSVDRADGWPTALHQITTASAIRVGQARF